MAKKTVEKPKEVCYTLGSNVTENDGDRHEYFLLPQVWGRTFKRNKQLPLSEGTLL
jgi:hypothetical protein